VAQQQRGCICYRPERGIYVVCDGMGGAAGGEGGEPDAVETVLERVSAENGIAGGREAA